MTNAVINMEVQVSLTYLFQFLRKSVQESGTVDSYSGATLSLGVFDAGLAIWLELALNTLYSHSWPGNDDVLPASSSRVQRSQPCTIMPGSYFQCFEELLRCFPLWQCPGFIPTNSVQGFSLSASSIHTIFLKTFFHCSQCVVLSPCDFNLQCFDSW